LPTDDEYNSSDVCQVGHCGKDDHKTWWGQLAACKWLSHQAQRPSHTDTPAAVDLIIEILDTAIQLTAS